MTKYQKVPQPLTGAKSGRTKNPRSYPDTLISAESGRPMKRGYKPVTLTVEGVSFDYNQPGWWCSLDDPNDTEGQLVDEDNVIADMAMRSAKALALGQPFPPVVIRAIRLRCKLSQREAGEVFGTGEKSFEKYEAGQIVPSKPTQQLLRLAMVSPHLFKKPLRGDVNLPSASDALLIQKTIKAAQLDRIYAPLFRHRETEASG